MVEMRNLYAFPLPMLKLFEYVELAFSLSLFGHASWLVEF